MNTRNQVPLIFSGKTIKSNDVKPGHFVSLTNSPLDATKVIRVEQKHQVIIITTMPGEHENSISFPEDHLLKLYKTYSQRGG